MIGGVRVGLVESGAICSQDVVGAYAIFTGVLRRCVELVASQLAALLANLGS